MVKLTAKSWKFESGTISPNYKGSAVLSTDVLPECSRDNVVTYKLDYTVESQEGNLKCRENSVINGTWGVNTDKKSMYVKLSSEYMNKLEYVEVSDSTLKYRYSWTNIDGTFTIFYKFKAI
ncbi:lipocalin family protein [Flexibacter flexilis]|uniref:lipocalin family protein n=1 Tax=Flexibacter flexilis TaxID=998 RepID=UPI00116058B6|nr:lipocalin family protein [Flexibacter flexilis]